MAALAVFASHAIGIRGTVGYLDLLPLNVLWNGQAAVVFFILMSGFALHHSLVRASPSPRAYARFVSLRVVRLYPAYWASLALALAIRVFALSPARLAGWSDWATTQWTTPLSLSQLLPHLLLVVPGLDTHLVSPAIWVLVLEARFSLLAPPLVWFVSRAKSPRPAIIAMVVAALLAAMTPALTYLPVFVAGSLLARYYDRACRAFRSLGSWRWVALLASTELLAIARGPEASFGAARVGLALTVAVGWVVIMLAAGSVERVSTVLQSGIAQRASRLAYAFYLVHLPILLAVASWWPGRTAASWTAGAGVSLLLAVAASAILYAVFERPAVRLTHHFGTQEPSQRAALNSTTSETAPDALDPASRAVDSSR